MRRKKERSKAVTFPRKNELPQVGLEPTTLYTLDNQLHVHVYLYMRRIFSRKSEPWVCCVALPCLFVCLCLLLSFFLLSSLIKTCIYTWFGVWCFGGFITPAFSFILS